MKTSPKCSVTQFVPSHTIPHPNAPSFRTLGPKLARKRFAAAWWIPSYFNKVWPHQGDWLSLGSFVCCGHTYRFQLLQ